MRGKAAPSMQCVLQCRRGTKSFRGVHNGPGHVRDMWSGVMHTRDSARSSSPLSLRTGTRMGAVRFRTPPSPEISCSPTKAIPMIVVMRETFCHFPWRPVLSLLCLLLFLRPLRRDRNRRREGIASFTRRPKRLGNASGAYPIQLACRRTCRRAAPVYAPGMQCPSS